MGWVTCRQLLTLSLLPLTVILNAIVPTLSFQDAQHITAILGESVVFNCNVDFPEDHPVPYVLQWEKKGLEVPVYIWYDSYPPHYHDEFKGRASGVQRGSHYGLASLNLTAIKESDQGWYQCRVVFLNRSPNQHKNGTWFHLDVHAPPRFSVTPEDVIYVNLGDAIILNCQAEGTPAPEILWYRDANPVDISATIGIFNDGTELRISNIRHEDIGDYTCLARNGEGQISHTARVIIAGGAVIMVPPTNQTKLEGEKVEFTCEAKALPGNVTVRWFREGAPVQEALEKRVDIRRDGSLIVNPVSAEDSGLYLCEVTNGIGEPQSASAYLSVEYPAKVTFTPTVQYLPFRLGGVVQCYIKANPPLQYVTWTKERRLLEPYQTKDIVIMNNGSLLFTRVNDNHAGRYSCTPYNAQGTQGSSGTMEVLVRKPPFFTVEPEALYQRKMGDTVEMPCEAQESEDTQKPKITWHRRDGSPLPKGRVHIAGGNITIENLRRTDFGYYQCVASNEVATIVTTTQLVVEGTQPHAPYNLSGNASEFAVTLTWLPGYSGGPDYKQDYTIWYREANVANWSQIPVTPPGSTQVTINHLTPGTKYEFQVIGKNALGDGMLSKVIEVKTLEVVQPNPNPEKSEKEFDPSPPDAAGSLLPEGAPRERRLTVRSESEHPGHVSQGSQLGPLGSRPRLGSGLRTLPKDVIDFSVVVFPTDSAGLPAIPPILRPRGPKPGPPRNLTVTEYPNGFLITWQAPQERSNLVQHYTIKYRTDAQWKTLNKQQIRAEETSFLVKNLVGGRTYHFRVLANSMTSYEASEEVKFPVPARVKHKAITAGVVGGILFFIVAIILSVCAVKICNKRKRRKQEKAYNMVACRITDSRNGGQPPGVSQVPLKKRGQGRVPGVTSIVDAGRWLLEALGLGLGLGLGSSRASSVVNVNMGVGLDVDEVDGPSAGVGGGGIDGIGLARIHRAPDGRFVLGASSRSSVSSSSDDGGFLSRGRAAVLSVAALSGASARASWRRPLVRCPSNLSLRSDGSGESGVPRGLTTAIVHPAHAHHHYANQRTLARSAQAAPAAPELPSVAAIYTPSTSRRSRTPRFVSSSPALSPAEGSPPSVALSPAVPWSPALNFSDLSSVRTPAGVAAAALPAAGYQQLRSVHERYAQELPSLSAIHEQQQQLMLQHGQAQRPPRPASRPQPQPRHVFLPIPSRPSPRSPPRIRIPAAPIPATLSQASPWTDDHDTPSRATTATLSPWNTPTNSGQGFGHGLGLHGLGLQGHPAVLAMPSAHPHRARGGSVRHARSAPELSVRSRPGSGSRPGPTSGASPFGPFLDTSPESRSSSSGFGSKNTSSQPNQSGSTASPPYRPPPPPPGPPPLASVTVMPSMSTSRHGMVHMQSHSHGLGHGKASGISDWLGITLPHRPSPSPFQDKQGREREREQGCDVSVDGHYEFDAVFVGTPTRDERGLSDSETAYPADPDQDEGASATASAVGVSQSWSSDSFSRRAKQDIEARVQAMKEEFAAFRQRQARRRRSPQLESVC